MVMSFALELRGISKRFVVGAAGCTGAVRVLRSVDLSLRAGEAAAVAGAPGAGKSTLLLCAAALLRVDSGDVTWFGDQDRSAGSERATYYFAGGSPVVRRFRRGTKPHIHLVDGPESLCLVTAARIARWIDRRSEEGDAVLIATRSVEIAREIVPRPFVLRGGCVHADPAVAVPARVAESVGWNRR